MNLDRYTAEEIGAHEQQLLARVPPTLRETSLPDEIGQPCVLTRVALRFELGVQRTAVRRSRRGRWASVSSALVNAAANGVSLVVASLRRYFGCVPGAALSHRLIVLRDKLLSLAISLIDFLSRKYMPRILPNQGHGDHPLFPCRKKQQDRLKHPGQYSLGITLVCLSVSGRRQQS